MSTEVARNRFNSLKINQDAKNKRNKITLWDSAEWAMNAYSNSNEYHKPLRILNNQAAQSSNENSLLIKNIMVTSNPAS